MSRPCWFGSTDARATHTGDTLLVDYVTIPTFKFQANTTNIVLYGATTDGGTTGTDVSVKLYDGATYLDGAINRQGTNQGSGGLFHVVGFAVVVVGGIPANVDLALKYGCEANSGHTAGIQDGWIAAFPLGPNDVVQVADGESTISVGAWAAGTDKATLSFTPGTAGDYLILAKVNVQPGTASTDAEIRLYDGTTAYGTTDNLQARTVSTTIYPHWMTAVKKTGLSGAQTWKVQVGANANSTKAKHARIVAIRIADIPEILYGEARSSTTTTSTTLQIRTSATHTAKARPHIEIAGAVMRHNQTTLFKMALTEGGVAVDATGLQAGSTTSTNNFVTVKGRVNTPAAGSRTLGLGYCANSADTTTIEEAWVLAIRPNSAVPPVGMQAG